MTTLTLTAVDPLDVRQWRGLCGAPNGDVYACTYGFGGDIYVRSGGTGAFTALGVTPESPADPLWNGMGVDAGNGDVYAVNYGDHVYKRTAGTGSFVALSDISFHGSQWTGVTVAPGHDVYASGNVLGVDDIYVSAGGTGTFTGLGETGHYWVSVAAAPNGDVYAADNTTGLVYIRTGGTGSFTSTGQAVGWWAHLAVDQSSGDVYLADFESQKIYKRTGGTGAFELVNSDALDWSAIAVSSSGVVYTAVNGGVIYSSEGLGPTCGITNSCGCYSDTALTVPEYTAAMLSREITMAQKFGVALDRSDITLRAHNRALLNLIGALVRCCVLAGVFDNAGWECILDQAAAGEETPEPLNPPEV